MRLFMVRYWRVLFWINVVLAVIHALNGANTVFLALGMAVLCNVMVALLNNSTEN